MYCTTNYNTTIFSNNTRIIQKLNDIALEENIDRGEFITIYKKAIENKCPRAMTGLGQYYENIEINYELMKKYYLDAIELGYQNAMIELGRYYELKEKNYPEMKKYYQMLIDLGNDNIMYNLGIYYKMIENNYTMMKKYFQMAIDKGNSNSMYSMGIYYEDIEFNSELVIKYYLMAIEYNNHRAMFGLGYYYHKKLINYNLMKKYYLMAIQYDNIDAISALADYYLEIEKDLQMSKKYALIGCNLDNELCLDLLNKINYIISEIYNDSDENDKYTKINNNSKYNIFTKDIKQIKIGAELESTDDMFTYGYYCIIFKNNYNLGYNYLSKAWEVNHNKKIHNFGIYPDKLQLYLTEQIAQNNADAQYYMGMCYLEQNKDYINALKYLEMASENGNIDALFNLGFYYQYIDKDYNMMQKYYLKAIDNSKVINELGNYYYSIEKNYDKAKEYYLMGCVKLNSDSMYNLAILYKEIKEDIGIYKAYLAEGYNLNNIKCIEELGEYFYSKKKYDMVIKYYLEAIELKSNKAMYLLAMYYFEIEKNHKLGNKYFTMAKDNDNPDALHMLGRKAHSEADYDLMKYYYLKAIKKNHLKSIKCLAIYYKNIERNYTEMKKYYIMGIDMNDVDMMYLYGFYFESIEKDFEQMKKYYQMAINKCNHSVAIISMAEYYKKNKKYILAEKYYKMGADLNVDECISELGKIHSLENKNECICELGKLYYLRNNYNDAIKYLELSILNNNIFSLMYLTEIYKEQQKYDIMIKYYKLGSEMTNNKCKDNENLNKYYLQKNDACLFELAKYYHIIEENNKLASMYLNLIKNPDENVNKLMEKIE